MAGFGLRKNTVFDWKGSSFRIDRLQPNGEVLLESINGGTLSLVPRQQLLDDFAQGLISAATSTEQATQTMPSYSRPLDQLSQEAQRETKRRRSYLEAVCADRKPVFTPDYLEPIIEQVAEKIGDTTPPSVTSVYRWHKRLILANDARTLVPRYDLRGAKKTHRSTRIRELLAEAVAEAFNATPLATGQNIYSRLLAKVDIENRRSLSSTPCVAPSDRTVYRMLAKVDQYEMTALREGKASADRRFRIGKAAIKPTRILERVEIDHTPLDLFLVDERTWLPLGRPTLTVAIDTYSRMLWGYYLSYGSPSAAAVIGAMRHGILPKSPTEIAIEGLSVDHRWPTYGIPETLVADNGLEFHGIDLESLAFDLGFVLVFCPKRQPRFKGTVERFLKTINYKFAHQIPGASFARFHLRGDYDPQQCAVMTLAQFKQLFEKWVVDDYAQTKHAGIGTTPWHRWHEGLAAHEPQLPPDLKTLQQRIGQSSSRKLRRDGFELNGVRYNGDALAPILRRYGEGVEVRVVFDPEDLGSISVWGPDDADPKEVQALDLTYASGLSQKQNSLIRQIMREDGAKIEDRESLQRARNDIAKTIEELMVSRKQKDRHRSAHFRGISSSKPHGTETQTERAPESPKRPPVTTIKQAGKTPAASLELPPILQAFQMSPAKRGGHENN